MATLRSNALKHWARIIRQWPTDKVRPESIAFQTVMQQRIQRSTQPATSSQEAQQSSKVQEAPPWDENRELKEVNALYNLLENQFTRRFPMPDKLRHPASDPAHYDNVVREMEEAPTRSWFDGIMKRIRGSLRLS